AALVDPGHAHRDLHRGVVRARLQRRAKGHGPHHAHSDRHGAHGLCDRFLMKDKENDLSKDEVAKLSAYKASLDNATKFIPLWVKVAVAIALGLGTMVGWKRIVVTVGEKIGKVHMTYGQGACAEVVAAGTIAAADMYGLPVSTTHVLSSGVAGTMAANG